MYNPFDDYKIILEWMEHKEGDTFQHSKDEFVQALRRYADWFETLEDQVISVKAVIIPDGSEQCKKVNKSLSRIKAVFGVATKSENY